MILRFGNYELDLDRIVLRRGGEEVPVEPQAFDVLAYLAARQGQVVRKEELLDEVWGDRFVSESALTTRIKTVRRAVGDDGSRQEIIRTVHGKGYEFVAEVERGPEGPMRPGPKRPTIAGLGPGLQTLIGRESLLSSLTSALDAHRLITLVGPGGVGKTSLGLELARLAAAGFADGVHAVELVSVGDDAATAAAFATAIDVNLRRGSSIDDAIVELLRPRHSLLLLDNCEHLIESVAALVSRILREAPSVAIVATSREPLAVAGEQVWVVEPLSIAAPDLVTAETVLDIPAVALFVARARAADPGFALDDVTAGLVVEICRRLDGIPLAVELAAARSRAVGVAEMARRLDERFALLQVIQRGGDPRHRTIRDAIAWSYDSLQRAERDLFTALSVFAGSFDLASAEAISPGDDVLDVLTRLTERSMLSVRPQAGGAIRYEMLETLREYGRTRLADDRAAQLLATHSTHFAALASSVEQECRGPEEGRAMARAEASFADLRSAQRFAIESGALDRAFELIGAIREFAMRAMRYEVFAWAGAACRVPGALDHPDAPLLTGVQAYGAWVRGEFDLALDLAEKTRGLEVALDVAPSGLAERVLANVYHLVDQPDRAHVEASRQVELAEASGTESRIVHACYMFAVGLAAEGDHDEAADLVARARQQAERTGSPTDLASVEVATGFSSLVDADALEAFQRADRLASRGGNRWMSAFARTEASGLLVARGEVEAGCAGLAEMVALWSRAGDWSQQWHTLSRCVIALHSIGNRELAMELVGAIEAHARLGVAPMTAILRDVVLDTRQTLVQELGEDRSARLCSDGAASPVEDVVIRTRRALLLSS